MFGGYRIDRRRYKRFQMTLSVRYQVLSQGFLEESRDIREFDAQTIDISIGGMAMKSGHSLPERSLLEAQLIVPDKKSMEPSDSQEVIKVLGIVRYSASADPGDCRMGIEFLQLTEEQENKIRELFASPLYANLEDSYQSTDPATQN